MSKVLLTRPQQRISEDNTFSSALKAEGIDVIEIPMITIAYPHDTKLLDDAFMRLAKKEFDLCVLSSPTAIEYFHDRAESLGIDKTIRDSVGFATIGAKSAEK